MAEMINLVVGGVPEHFNYPWYLALKDKAFQEKGINLRWRDFYAGTGAMCQALRKGEIDMAVVLTEGIIRDITLGNPSYIIQVYVGSPLLWGIHVAANSGYEHTAELQGTKAAISRYGSGSHLMAYVLAEEMGWSVENDMHFELVENIDGALSALPDGRADYFLWEKFTTQPYVDEGVFRCIGQCPTPWPCFVIAVRKEVWHHHKKYIEQLVDIINSYTHDFKGIEGIDKLLSKRYSLELQDVRDWLEVTRWSDHQLTEQQLDLVQKKLLQLGLIESRGPADLFFPKK